MTLPEVLDQYLVEDRVLICLDLETNCFRASKHQVQKGIYFEGQPRVCEVGISVLDGRALSNVQLGDRGTGLIPYIDSYSLAIKEAKHLKNQRHNKSFCREVTVTEYEFGKTKWISKAQLESELSTIVKKYVDVPSSTYVANAPTSLHSSRPSSCGMSEHRLDKSCCLQASAGPAGYRPVTILYFCAGNDTLWLKQHGIDLAEMFPNSRILDIQTIWPSTDIAYHLTKPQCSAADLFSAIGITVGQAHNGGNDAFYELQAYLAGLCLTDNQITVLKRVGAVRPCLPGAWELRGGTPKHLRANRAIAKVDLNLSSWPTLSSVPQKIATVPTQVSIGGKLSNKPKWSEL